MEVGQKAPYVLLIAIRRHKVDSLGAVRQLLAQGLERFRASAENEILELLVIAVSEGIVAGDLGVIVDMVGFKVGCF